MALEAEARRAAPFGLSFGIDDLLAARGWAEARRLRMQVVLDRVIDGAEFEEMLLLLAADGRRRIATVWRTEGGIVSQAPGRMPRLFSGMAEALGALAPPRRRRWFGGSAAPR